ncbi:sugar ABC transporter ATP-binding protein [Rhodococcus koreensis]
MGGPADSLEAGLAFVHQELALVPRLTVADNVFLGLGYPTVGARGGWVRRRELNRRTREVLARLGATFDPDARVAELTVAEQRLVMIGRGLATDAKVLVLDEPTASLTDEEIEHLLSVVRRLRDQGIAIVYVSHRLNEILELTDRVVVMRDGAVVDEAATSSLTQDELVAKITGDVHAVDVDGGQIARRTPGNELLRVMNLASGKRLHDVSFNVRAGEIVGLAGLVGAGRSEVARSLFGVDRIEQGSVYLKGQRTRISSPARALDAGIVMLPEERKTLGNITGLSIADNMTLPTLPRYRFLRGLPFPSLRNESRVVTEMIGSLKIKTDTSTKPVAQLSGGNQQKVVLAKWLLHGADVYIFDEPTHGIDVQGKEDVYATIEELARQGRGVVFISSEFAELLKVCDRLVVLREGYDVAELDARAVTENDILDHCYPDSHDRSAAVDVVESH